MAHAHVVDTRPSLSSPSKAWGQGYPGRNERRQTKCYYIYKCRNQLNELWNEVGMKVMKVHKQNHGRAGSAYMYIYIPTGFVHRNKRILSDYPNRN